MTPAQQDDSELTFDNVPNRLTLLRIAFVPLVVGLLFLGTSRGDLAAAIVFGLASITDYFDGYYARTRKLITIYGKLMDPLADKFLVVCSLIMLQHLGRIHPWVTMILICRELMITSLRALASAEGVVIAASPGGKWKTAFQMMALPFVMLGNPGDWANQVGMAMIYVSLAMSLWSAKDYVVAFFKALKENRRARAQQRALDRQAAREIRHAHRSARLAAKAARAAKNSS